MILLYIVKFPSIGGVPFYSPTSNVRACLFIFPECGVKFHDGYFLN